MKSVTNTTDDLKRRTEAGDFSAIFEGQPNAIYASEARGQQELVKSDVLPADCRGREALEAHGVKFGEPVEGDPLFVYATLPKGWLKRGTDHSMHSELVDERGRVRGEIFYKAAFYDRRADLRVVRRFSISQYDNCDADGKPAESNVATHMATTIKDCGEVIHLVGVVALRDYPGLDALEVQANKWLSDHRPNWQDAAAYWSEK